MNGEFYSVLRVRKLFSVPLESASKARSIRHSHGGNRTQIAYKFHFGRSIRGTLYYWNFPTTSFRPLICGPVFRDPRIVSWSAVSTASVISNVGSTCIRYIIYLVWLAGWLLLIRQELFVFKHIREEFESEENLLSSQY